MPWIRDDSLNLTESDIIKSCDNSLRRIKTDRIDLYQIHWPVRSVPAFGRIYFEPTSVNIEYSSIHRQLESLNKLVRAGKIRSVGLSNETPYGVHEFIRIAEEFGLPRIASVQNCYNLVNRSVENALDETLYRLNVSLLAYSPLAFGLLTGKYNHSGLTGAEAPQEGRMKKFEMFRQQRWGRKEALAAARKYSDLARTYGLTPLQLALAFCYTNWRVTSTIIGVTCMDQLEECISAIEIKLSDEILKKIDAIRWKIRDPAQ